MNDKYTLEEINYAIGGRHGLNDEQYRELLRTIRILDNDIIDKITDEIFFFDVGKGEAWRFPTKHLRGMKSIICFSSDIFKFSIKKMQFNILHEIAHHILDHKCFVDISGIDNIKRQEKEADKLAKEWIEKASRGVDCG